MELILVIVAVLLMAAAIVVWWALIAATAHVNVAAWVVAAAFILETAFLSAPSLTIGMNISTNDVAFVLLSVAVLVRIIFLKGARSDPVFLAWVVFGGLIFLSLAIGLVQHGSKAGVEVRQNFYFLMAGWYFASFDYNAASLCRLWRIAQWTAWIIVGVVSYRWVGLQFGFVSMRLVELAGASSEFRVIGSAPTFFLAAVGLGYAAFWLRDGRSWSLFGTLIMLSLTVVLQHRSVWVAGIGGLSIIAWHGRAAIQSKFFSIVAIAVLTSVALGAYMVLSPSSRLIETITESALAVGETRGTHTARMEGWKALLDEYKGYSPLGWLVGKAYGHGYERYVMGRIDDFSPHNFFVQLLLRVGALGLVLLLFVHFSLHARTRAGLRQATADNTPWVVALAIIVANFLYFIPYQGFSLQGVFYGVLMGYTGVRLPLEKKQARLPGSSLGGTQ